MTAQKYIDQIKTFKQKAGQSNPTTPTEPTQEEKKLLARLILEEALELVDALGVTVMVYDTTGEFATKLLNMNQINTVVTHELNLTEVMDACCDIFWVGVGGPAVALGISDKLEACLNEVGESNLSKFIDGKKCPDTGKWLKGPSYRPAQIAEIMEMGNEM